MHGRYSSSWSRFSQPDPYGISRDFRLLTSSQIRYQPKVEIPGLVDVFGPLDPGSDRAVNYVV